MGTFRKNRGSHSDGRCPNFEIWGPSNRPLIWFCTSESNPDDRQSRLRRCWVIVYGLHLSPGDHQGVPWRSCWNLEVFEPLLWAQVKSHKFYQTPAISSVGLPHQQDSSVFEYLVCGSRKSRPKWPTFICGPSFFWVEWSSPHNKRHPP